MRPRKSNRWFIENVSTSEKFYLNVGKFVIGRDHHANDLNMINIRNIPKIEWQHCSNQHCSLELSTDQETVRLSNISRFGTFVNDIKANGVILEVGDIITLVDRAVIEEMYRPLINKLSFILRQNEINPEVVSKPDPEEDVIIISDDEDDSKKIKVGRIKKHVKFAEDYEIGEPSIKKEPTPGISPIAANRNDGSPKGDNKVLIKCSTVNTKTEREPEKKAAKLPLVLSKKPNRIAHTPKVNNPIDQSENPQKQAKKRESRSPPRVICEPKSPKYSLDSLLTPSNSPMDIDEPEFVDPTAKIIGIIINWDAAKIMNPKFRKEDFFKSNVQLVPKKTFTDVKNYESVQEWVLKVNAWHKLNHYLKDISADSNILRISSIETNFRGKIEQLIFNCQCTGQTNWVKSIEVNEVLVVEATVSSSSARRTFLGVITQILNKKENLVSFKLQVGLGNKDDIRIPSRARIIANHNVNQCIRLYETIFNARHSSLFEEIINPSEMHCLQFGVELNPQNCIYPLNEEQHNTFSKIVNNTIEALNGGNAFATVINGGPGTGKSKLLIETLIELVRSENFNKKGFKILVTGATDDDVDAIGYWVDKYRNDEKQSGKITRQMREQLKFVRYGNVPDSLVSKYIAQYQARDLANRSSNPCFDRYQEILQTAKIIFAPNEMLIQLKKYVDKIDVILFENASECDEMNSTVPLLFSPSSLVMFGDSNRNPKDSRDLISKYPKSNTNQSMFKRLLDAKYYVLHLNRTYRFSKLLLHMLNETMYYEKRLELFNRDQQFTQLKGFAVLHYENENEHELVQLMKRVVEITYPKLRSASATPSNIRYGIIRPANVNTETVAKALDMFRSQVTLSSIQNFIQSYWFFEKDIVIIWVNDSMKYEYHHRFASFISLMTLARKAVYFIGSTNTFLNDPNLGKLYRYAVNSKAICEVKNIRRNEGLLHEILNNNS
ncbi:uncharacterized protein LOC116347127 [Contarinia nasturtii]|uniref:uncharacterized protein LOC116347127 n=1 Tax=Contarinia nasturtii TaxID=265458 RepID=UPI0012D396F4|nr:uncharacterized protein LOC116347127 [Contarinia nasturtii]XP_031633447.1 uncharacterized protein LOC116347127 [Contarinia nasturtii]XP_031633448.1 uncharacterized protein LOC116347127 [Contarinia nasturtii]XP_031633449.1 uncharacterized protein LOC116347127 [Contarinia nasturtii]XP_031633450.1 uncharacterized protein LOC116347127 [Contarinia nasturtii]XP_031633451.1 uncharacterized protein LOC116347127 [Contarinia nasturtii]XP_031633452.1 uncharacterized protein LOC116347127 [Contarinia n